MSSKPPDDPPSKPDDPSLQTPVDSSSKASNKKDTAKKESTSPTKKYIQLIKKISRRGKEDSKQKESEQPFEVKKRVEVKRPVEEELKKKLSELSSRLEELKNETKSVISKTSSKISKLETSGLSLKKVVPPLPGKGPVASKPSSEDNTSRLSDKSTSSKSNISSLSFMSKMKSIIKNINLPGKSSTQGPRMSAPGRPMKFPYTYSAKIAQFPMKFYVKNNWMWKYYFIALAISFPVFYKLGRLSNAPENVKKWEEIRKRDFTPGGHH